MKDNELKVTANLFSRIDTKALKGIAIILMLFHHLVGFPDRWPLEFTGFKTLWPGFINGGYLHDIALNAKLCVPIFFFLGGYGLYKRWINGKFRVSSTIMNLYKEYWKVFIIFIPIAFIFFNKNTSSINILCTKYNIISIKDFITTIIANFIGYSSSLNGEWWFFGSYVCVIPLGYLFCKFNKNKNDFWHEFIIVLAIDILIRNIFPNISEFEPFSSLKYNIYYNNLLTNSPFSSTFFAGIVFAKYNTIITLKKTLKSITFYPILALGIIIIIYWSRMYIIGNNLDIIYTSLLIPTISILLDWLKPLKKIFVFLGKHSTNMWLIHSFYCYYFYEFTKIIYSTQNVWINLIILLIISLATSVLLELLYAILMNLSKKVKYILPNKKNIE